MKVSDALNQTLDIIQAQHSEGCQTTDEGVETIIKLLQTVLPEILAMEAAVEAVAAERLRQRGPNIIPLGEYQRTHCIPRASKGGAA